MKLGFDKSSIFNPKARIPSLI